MLLVNNLTGFGAGNRAIGVPSVDFTDAGADSGAVSNTLTFNSKTSAGPHTILCVTWADLGAGGDTLSGATWNGDAGSILHQQNDATSLGAALLYWAGAKSGNIVLTYSDIVSDAGLTSLSVVNLRSSTPVDTDDETGTGSADLDSLSAPGAGGIRIAVYANLTDTTAVTWTNANELSDFDMGADRHSVAYSLDNSAVAITADGAAGVRELIVGVSLR